METDRSFGAVVFRRNAGDNREYLLVLHASGNHWDHPKGHAEQGESPRETAEREIFEESSERIRFIDGFQTQARWILPSGREKIVTYFLAERVDAEKSGIKRASVPEDEILDSCWLPFSQALERITYKTGKTVIEEAEDFLKRL